MTVKKTYQEVSCREKMTHNIGNPVRCIITYSHSVSSGRISIYNEENNVTHK